jgi:inner membrane protein
MDPLTHFLTGACIARTGLNRKTALATAVLTISAEFADIDVLWDIRGPIYSLQHHRGWTHSFVGAPVVAVASLVFVLAIDRLWKWRRKPRQLPIHYGWLLLCALIGSLAHLLLDFTNSYGLRPFMPFNYRWYHWDIMQIIDPLLLLFLLGGLILPSLFGLINEEIGARRTRGRVAATVALVLTVLLWGFRDFEHRRAVSMMSALEYGEGLPVRLSAFPYALTPFTWYGVVENDNTFVTFNVDTLQGEVDPQRRARTYHKPRETPASDVAKRSHLGRVYLDWADYPFVETEPIISTGGFRVRFLDLRYMYPNRPTGVLGATELLDKTYSSLPRFTAPVPVASIRQFGNSAVRQS